MDSLSDERNERYKCITNELENDKFEYVQFLKPPYLEARNMVVGNPALRCAVREKSIVLWYLSYAVGSDCDERVYEYYSSPPVIDYGRLNYNCGILLGTTILYGEIKQVNELVLMNFLSHNMSSVQQHSIDTLSEFPQIFPYIEPKEYYVGTNMIESAILYNSNAGNYYLNQDASTAYNRTINCIIKNNFNPLYFEPLQPEQKTINEGWSGYFRLLLSYLEYCGKIWKTSLYINGKKVGSFRAARDSGEPTLVSSIKIEDCEIVLDLRPSSGLSIVVGNCKLNDNEEYSGVDIPFLITIFYGPRRPSLDPFIFNFRICFNGITTTPTFNLIADLVEEC
ncbi:MAG: hypothetical protein QXK80_03700 [Candidatus Pacearchaeota archaeon]